MVSSDKQKLEKITVKINRQKNDKDEVSAQLIFEKLDKNKDLIVDLSTSNVDDIKNLFDSIFEYIYDLKKIIEFELTDEKEKDLYHQVSQEIITQLNSEVSGSAIHFNEIWGLTEPKTGTLTKK